MFQESEYLFNVDAYKSEYSKIDESGHFYESRKISSSVSLVLACVTVFEVVDCVVVKVGCTWPFFANIK